MIIVWVWQLVKKKQLAKEMVLGCLGGISYATKIRLGQKPLKQEIPGV